MVAWILLSLGILVILVKLAQWLIKSGTVAKVRISEEKLRQERLYANERLIERGERCKDVLAAEQMLIYKPEEPYIKQPYTHLPRRHEPAPHETPDILYDGGLPPLNIRSDWED